MRIELIDVLISQIDNGFEIRSDSERECYFTKQLAQAKLHAKQLIDKIEQED